MKFILLFGPQAVGKMSVGLELTKMTGLYERFFLIIHNRFRGILHDKPFHMVEGQNREAEEDEH